IDLWYSEPYCVTATHPKTGQKRISLTGNVVNNAKEVYFLVTGNDKANIVKDLIGESLNSTRYPASLVRPSSNNLYWYLDKPASTLL
ncbi:MAG: 6-phosphogluconolactonase, partial [Eudoraea sp.]|nr:6-phosphogluconolactonase [Eudoraea sp.]NNK30572.1 6-phosphogluconolactonase [Flavobacteriaceae bacterium]